MSDTNFEVETYAVIKPGSTVYVKGIIVSCDIYNTTHNKDIYGNERLDEIKLRYDIDVEGGERVTLSKESIIDKLDLSVYPDELLIEEAKRRGFIIFDSIDEPRPVLDRDKNLRII